MEEHDFQNLAEQIQQHFADGTYQEGLTLASKELPRHPEEYTMINYWRMCFAARLNEFPLANKIFESVLASGIWLSDAVLRQSPSLESIQGNEDFERLAKISEKLREADGGEVPMLISRPENACKPGEEGCPLFFFLHANMDTAQNNLLHWGYLASEGWMVGLPQSGWGMWTGAYSWTSYELTRQECLRDYDNLTEQYSIDQDSIVLGGFSMGGAYALEMTLNGELPVRGFILLGPGGGIIDDIDEIERSAWWEKLEGGWRDDLSGVILMGEADETIPREKIRKLTEMLNAAGIRTRLLSFPGLGHAYPPDFENVAAQAFDFIFSSEN